MDQNNDDRGIDLSHVLDDSSSRVKFEGEQFQRPQSFRATTPKIVELVIKYSGGYIKDKKTAQYALLGFVAVAIVVFFIFGVGSFSNSGKALPYEKTYQGQLP